MKHRRKHVQIDNTYDVVVLWMWGISEAGPKIKLLAFIQSKHYAWHRFYCKKHIWSIYKYSQYRCHHIKLSLVWLWFWQSYQAKKLLMSRQLSAVVTCAKLWPVRIIIFQVRATLILMRFGLWASKLLVKWLPGDACIYIIIEHDHHWFSTYNGLLPTSHWAITHISANWF